MPDHWSWEKGLTGQSMFVVREGIAGRCIPDGSVCLPTVLFTPPSNHRHALWETSCIAKEHTYELTMNGVERGTGWFL